MHAQLREPAMCNRLVSIDCPSNCRETFHAAMSRLPSTDICPQEGHAWAWPGSRSTRVTALLPEWHQASSALLQPEDLLWGCGRNLEWWEGRGRQACSEEQREREILVLSSREGKGGGSQWQAAGSPPVVRVDLALVVADGLGVQTPALLLTIPLQVLLARSLRVAGGTA